MPKETSAAGAMPAIVVRSTPFVEQLRSGIDPSISLRWALLCA
ncbi:MAG: hypothetical protein WAM97_00370 [Acidimicrobiales bacterium]